MKIGDVVQWVQFDFTDQRIMFPESGEDDAALSGERRVTDATFAVVIDRIVGSSSRAAKLKILTNTGEVGWVWRNWMESYAPARGRR